MVVKSVCLMGILAGAAILLAACSVSVSGNPQVVARPEEKTTQPQQEVVKDEANATRPEAPIAAETTAAKSGDEPPQVGKAGPTEAQLRVLAGLPKQGLAPELLNETWLNSEPLRLADLRGKVVIVDFWTYG